MRAAAVNPKKVQIANIAPKNFTVDQQHDEWFLRVKITRRVDASQSLRNLSRNVVPSKELDPVAPDSRVILPRQLRKVCRPSTRNPKPCINRIPIERDKLRAPISI